MTTQMMLEMQVRNDLQYASNATARELANDNDVVKAIATQIHAVLKVWDDPKQGGIAKFIIGQLSVSKDLYKEAAKTKGSPAKLMLLSLKKILNTANFGASISNNKWAKCGSALTILAVDVPLAEITVPLEFGSIVLSPAALLEIYGVLNDGYEVGNACNPFIN